MTNLGLTLVTGATGCLGNTSIYHLVGNNRYVRCIVRAQQVNENVPNVKLPKLMPEFIANLIASIGGTISKLTDKPPLITKSELSVLKRTGRPNGIKIQE